MRRLRSSCAVGAALAMFVLSGCGGGSGPGRTSTAPASGLLDTTRVERSIEQSIFTQRHIKATVRCQHNVPQRKGWHFVCFATTPAGQTPFVVTEVNDQGYVTYVGK